MSEEVKERTVEWEEMKVPEPEKIIDDGNTVRMRLHLSELAPDRIQFKPYGINYYTHNIYVEVSVPKVEVVEITTDNVVVLTPRGIALIADQLSSACEANYNEWRGRNKTF